MIRPIMMMTENEILAQLVPLLVEVLGVAPEAIRLDSVLVNDLGAESIDLFGLEFSHRGTIQGQDRGQRTRKGGPAGDCPAASMKKTGV